MKFETLTDTENRIAALIKQGYKHKAIMITLRMREQTYYKHIRGIKKKWAL